MFKLSKKIMTICSTIGIIARALFSGQKGPKWKGQSTVYISLANMAAISCPCESSRDLHDFCQRINNIPLK